MKKSEAIEQLGGTIKLAARACEITPSAISQWGDELNKAQTDRVQAALWRQAQLKRNRRQKRREGADDAHAS